MDILIWVIILPVIFYSLIKQRKADKKQEELVNKALKFYEEREKKGEKDGEKQQE